MEKELLASFRHEFRGSRYTEGDTSQHRVSHDTRAGEIPTNVSQYETTSLFVGLLKREKRFNLENFTAQHQLLTFSFVRHPYERSVEG